MRAASFKSLYQKRPGPDLTELRHFMTGAPMIQP
jgi:hypothetical protein